MFLRVLIGFVDWDVALPAQNRSILLAKQERPSLLADVAEGGLFGGGGEEREAVVLAGELVGVVDAVVAGGAEGGLVGGAVELGRGLAAHIAEDLHRSREGIRLGALNSIGE